MTSKKDIPRSSKYNLGCTTSIITTIIPQIVEMYQHGYQRHGYTKQVP